MVSCRKEIDLLPPYILGESFSAEMKKLGITRVVKLNSNESAWQPFPPAIEAMQRAVSGLNWYPEARCVELKSRLSERYGVPVEGIVVGHGANVLIRLLCMTYLSPGDEVVIPWPTFPPYRIAAALMGATIRLIPLRDWVHDIPAMLDAVNERTKMVFICNPNNPTGTILSKEEIEEYFRRVPEHVMTVLDEAYVEFVDRADGPPSIDYLRAGKPVTIFRSFSKVYALAGARVGYALTSRETAEVMLRAQEGFPVNHVAQAGAVASLGCDDLVAERVKATIDGCRQLENGFDELGLKHTRSSANFVWVDVERDSSEVMRKLMSYGVLVRPGKTYDSPSHIRVTVGTAEENEIFLEALRKVL